MSQLIKDIDRYYTDKISSHGATPAGVDWNGEASQLTRFRQLMRITQNDTRFILNDLGCGYGGLVDFLESTSPVSYRYIGYDVSLEMITHARERYTKHQHIEFFHIRSADEMQRADYTVSSGIFNVRMQYSDEEWLNHILHTLDSIDQASEKGFSFNCLTKYSDPEYMKDYLYYADPCFIFDHCKRHYSDQIALLHDYGLYEFTILVTKQEQAGCQRS